MCKYADVQMLMKHLHIFVLGDSGTIELWVFDC